MLSLSETKPSATKQLIFPVLAIICLALMLLFHWLYPIGLLIRFPFGLTELLLGGLGLITCFAAQRQFKKIGTTPYPFSRPGKPVTGGLFRYTRNPMYLGPTGLPEWGAAVFGVVLTRSICRGLSAGCRSLVHPF
jgi:protein-S-isoprenylcysteine O-methyltransferase Ste14